MSFKVIYNNPKKYRIQQDPGKYSVSATPNSYSAARVYLSTFLNKWNPYFSFLWTGAVSFAGPDYLISDFPDRRKITVINRDFDTTYIPGESSSIFRLVADADFIADDLDNLWFTDGVQNDVTVTDLVTGEYRTVVKFANAPPYDISALGLLRHDAVFTSEMENELAGDFDLWLFWLGLINYTL